MQPLILYTAQTPNGVKVSNFTEELKEAYPDFAVTYRAISFGKNEQKEEWFLKINPNGRIPALVDPNRNNFAVFETASIILYLEKHYDPRHLFSWSDSEDGGVDRRSEVLNWMFFIHGGLGPMQGQANHFVRYAPEQIEYAKDRYVNETKRLYRVLDRRLKDHDWLVGDKYSIADINAYPWLQYYRWAGIRDEEVPQSVRDYIERNYARPAVQRGMREPGGSNEWLDKMRSPEFWTTHLEEANQKAKEASAWVLQGMQNDKNRASKA
ncbi:uncharacterized protein PFL1_02511 [Pseudozyma flocculosa PF-1]|uniref:Glutathione S-transferase n=2 Tax=Pseudozyma flocculosa TaxID=84751 RepID=A0A061HB68_9BASI|nr:uncharacterized protein PFL1_02511 [Pseudozyma flocculosa PF-1]EPQ29838.1 hypothetical protein PFL1_02511 [Pseudozyma flocculosa PF-1]SPO37133.1 probable theta class glutathione s-transferase [Pseudozyma flocculosa]